MTAVESKLRNYALWTSGALGNRLRAWRTLEEYRGSGFAGKVSLRYLGDGGAWCAYDVQRDRISLILEHWRLEGADLSRVMFNEGAPDEAIVIQGEFFNDVLDGCVEGFLFSTVKGKMRDALKAKHVFLRGPWSRFVLRDVMTPSSWADFEALLELYPGHVLEVSVYSRNLGDIPGRNALVWEVRRY